MERNLRNVKSVGFALVCLSVTLAQASVKLGTNASAPFQYGVDSSGNSYVLANLTLNQGLSGLVITKLNSTGNAVYTARLGTNPTAGPYSFTLDNSGNTYTVVQMQSLSGVTGLYVVKVNASGTTVYSVRLGTNPTTTPFFTNVDSSGNLTLIANYTPLTGSAGLFATRLSASGSTTYSLRLGSSPAGSPFGAAMDSTGNCTVVSNMTNTSGVAGLYACKVSPTGKATYTTKLGTSPGIAPFGNILDSSGNLFNVSSLTSNSGTTGLFLNRVSATGTLSFAKQVGTNATAYPFGGTVDASGNTFLLNSYTPLSGSSGLWATKFDSSGNTKYATRLGSNAGASPFASTVDSALNNYVVSNMTNTSGLAGLYVTKLASSGTVAYSSRIGTSASAGPFDAHLDSSGNVYTLSNMLSNGNSGLWAYKLGATGNTVYNTRLGYNAASAPYFDVYDTNNNLYAVVSMTSLTGASGLYTLKMSNTGSTVFTTRLGLNPSAAPFSDYIDGYGNNFVMANMSGVNAPTGLYVARVNSSGTIVYNLRIGTSPISSLTKYILDASGNALVTSSMTPVGGSPGLYVTKVDSTGKVIF